MFDAVIDEKLKSLEALAPAGYSGGFRISFSRPAMYRMSYAPAWVEMYQASNFLFCDPTLAWGISHVGHVRWSDISIPDPFRVMQHAADHGLAFGICISTGKLSSRTIASAARSDREFFDEEIAAIEEIIEEVHDLVGKKVMLRETHHEALQLYAHGYSYDDICRELNIKPTALKARLAGARKSLGANSNVDAVRRAAELHLVSVPPHHPVTSEANTAP